MSECIFCKIILGEIKSPKVFEDDNVSCIFRFESTDTRTYFGDSKKHFENIFDIPSDILSNVTSIAKKVALAQKKSLDAQGVNILHALGECTQQTVFHFHLHIVARNSLDNIESFPRPKYAGEKPSETAFLLS